MKNPILKQSTEYNDNRISLYVGQNGKCGITGKKLEINYMEIHHKIPKTLGGKDGDCIKVLPIPIVSATLFKINCRE